MRSTAPPLSATFVVIVLVTLTFLSTSTVDARLAEGRILSNHHDTTTKQNVNPLALLPRSVLEMATITGSLTSQIGDSSDRTPCEGCNADFFHVFERGPSSWAVVTQTTSPTTGRDYCLAVFSDTSTVEDWILENLNPKTAEYCQATTEDEVSCCKMRKGFARTYESSFRVQLEEALETCANTYCRDPNDDDCVVLSGYSQGGGTAAVAALRLSHLNPQVIALEPPPIIFPDCTLIDSTRWYVFVNAFTRDDNNGLVYDVVPFLPGLGAVPLGHHFLLTEDVSGVAYLGLDTRGDIRGPFAVNPHYLRDDDNAAGVLDRIEAILTNSLRDENNNEPNNNNNAFIRATGISAGYPCNHDTECESLKCAQWEEDAGSSSPYNVCIATR